MGESGDILIRPVILLVVNVRLARGSEQAVLCGASSRRAACKVWPSVEPRQHGASQWDRWDQCCGADDNLGWMQGAQFNQLLQSAECQPEDSGSFLQWQCVL